MVRLRGFEWENFFLAYKLSLDAVYCSFISAERTYIILHSESIINTVNYNKKGTYIVVLVFSFFWSIYITFYLAYQYNMVGSEHKVIGN